MVTKNDVQVADLAAAVVASDPELRDDLKRLARDMIKHVRMQMKHGDDSMKSALAKTMLPHMLKAMNSVEDDERNAKMLKAYENMKEQFRVPEHTATHLPVVPVVEDLPPT